MLGRSAAVALAALIPAFGTWPSSATPRKVLGAAKRLTYSSSGDPPGAAAGEAELKIRVLLVDGQVKDWTTGDALDVTDRGFLVRRALRIDDALPGKQSQQPNRWVWQGGPWLMVDRTSGHVTALKLPHCDPGRSRVSWSRDYGFYCGLTASGKSLYAVVVARAGQKARSF